MLLGSAFTACAAGPLPHQLARWNVLLRGAALSSASVTAAPRQDPPLQDRGLQETPLLPSTAIWQFAEHTWASAPASASSPERL